MVHSGVKSITGLRVVVVVPTFNHGRSIGSVLDGLGRLGLPVLLVDDGSTDDTPGVLSRWAALNPSVSLTSLSHGTNLGKAAALRTGFERADRMGATHAITIDADGQLDPDDVPALLNVSRSDPRALILGTRPDTVADCPRRCLVGRLFASFAISLQTGLRLLDSQCGLRVYPLLLMRSVECCGGRYTFEAEIITRAARAGYRVIEVPVRCRYFTDAERASHFRPWRDSWAQARVHVGLIACGLLPWAGPKPVRDDEGRRGPHITARLAAGLNPLRTWQQVRDSHLGLLELGAALGFGVWTGVWPLLGLQFLVALFLSWRLHLQPAMVLLGALLSAGPPGRSLREVCATIGERVLGGLGADGAMSSEVLRWASSAIGGATFGFVVGFGVFWLVAGLGWLRPLSRAAGAHPDAPAAARDSEDLRVSVAEPAR